MGAAGSLPCTIASDERDDEQEGSGPMTGTVPSTTLVRLDTAAARRWAVVTRAAFAAHRAEIDALNVFPVPDGDTGTNLFLTFDAALDGARAEYEERAQAGRPLDDDDLVTEADLFARALLLTARGNSGVILSQIFRGFADEAAATEVAAIDGSGLASAMERADALAWASVTRPVEGTILSVSRAAAAAATSAASTPAVSCMPSCRPRSTRPVRRWPARRSSCRAWPGPASSTRVVPATCCCWSRLNGSSPGTSAGRP